MKNQMNNSKEESHFEDIEKEIICKDPGHKPPMHLYIPQGKRYIHICPACGNKIVITPMQYSLADRVAKWKTKASIKYNSFSFKGFNVKKLLKGLK